MLSSVALDLTGAFGIPRQPLGPALMAGALAVLVGITIVVRGQRVGAPGPPAAAAPQSSPVGPAWLLLGLVAGAVLPVQGALNARLRSALQQPITVALVSFLAAALTISVVLVALLALRRTPAPRLPSSVMPWWGWLGGLCAAGYVTGTFLLIPVIGAAVTVALTVTGQQLASAVLDARAWLQLSRRPFTAVRGAGLLLLVAGSLLVQLA
jgi:transporter family-2 protein